ncbi:xylulokinase [Desulfopila sp. IMCC35008]|uniref:xylulokinase n=1 Tax=Desulfopila sp. IMCC35008 TaxID=2653858 RepID=UPI0013D01BE8|nr:xylulokinase [Desulfopila sp. IMCC35008]
MTDRLYLGIDSGTQGTKCVVVSEKKQTALAESYCGYDLIENDRGGREQHPASWLDACRKVLREVLADQAVDPSLVRGIGVSGQQHGMVPLDKKGEVIRPAKLWCDTETVPQCKTITNRVGGEEQVLEKIGNQVAAGFTASKILWLQQNEPANYERLATVLLPHDYINYWLTGEKKTESGDGSGTAYFDVVNRCWSRQLLSAIDPSGKLEYCLPELIPSEAPHGVVTPARAAELGLPAGVLVSSGGGDNMMAAIGTGNVSPGVVTASLGTSGTIYAYSDSPVVDAQGELAAFCSSSGGWLPLVCTMNVTVTTELMRQMFGLELAEMNDQAAAVEPGAGGLILLPYFNGERTPALPDARATLTGMTSRNMRSDMFCRAAMEGAVFGLRYGLEVLKRNGIDPQEIRLTGGGAKSHLWRQIVADIFGCEVVCLQEEEAGATGAALQALWCDEKERGAGRSLQDITSCFVHLDEHSRVSPIFPNMISYETVYKSYLQLNGCMAKF